MADEGLRSKLSVSARTALIVVLVAVVAAFLIGFVPEYQRARSLEAQLNNSREELQKSEWKLQVADARSRGLTLFLELTKHNYGTAAEAANGFFEQVQSAAAKASDAAVKNGLQSVAGRKDEILAKIAKMDSSVESDVRDMLEQLQKLGT